MEDRLKTLSPQHNVTRLERLFAVEKALMRIQGARLPDLRGWFLKQQVGYHLYEDAQHADVLRRRRLELQAGRGSFQPLPPELALALEQPLSQIGRPPSCFRRS